MTDDLLGKIFYHLCEPGPLSLRHLLFVSTRFYSVTVNSAHLWATISLDYSFFHHFHKWPEQGNRFVEDCLIRSDPLPLCLYLDFSNINGRESTVFLPPLETFGKPNWRGSQRCVELIWNAARHQAPTIQRVVDLLPKSLPSLKHISLTYFDVRMGGSQFPNCPGLERVEILYQHAPFPRFWGTNFLHVTTLSFGNYTPWGYFDLATLSLFPVLRDLTLSTVRGTEDPVGINALSQVIFENLRILRTQGRISPAFLTKLVTPILEDLYIEANTDNSTSIHALQTSFNPLCRSIHALLPKEVSAEEPEWGTSLSNLVWRCAGITSLYISKWMGEECEKRLSGHGVVLMSTGS